MQFSRLNALISGLFSCVFCVGSVMKRAFLIRFHLEFLVEAFHRLADEAEVHVDLLTQSLELLGRWHLEVRKEGLKASDTSSSTGSSRFCKL